MRSILNTLSLLLMVVVAQHGAVIHELTHVASAARGESRPHADAVDSACGVCAAYAQVVTPAVSHAFHAPALVRVALDIHSEPPGVGSDATTPRPRSRGPPST